MSLILHLEATGNSAGLITDSSGGVIRSRTAVQAFLETVNTASVVESEAQIQAKAYLLTAEMAEPPKANVLAARDLFATCSTGAHGCSR